jgi:hypothetical protein
MAGGLIGVISINYGVRGNLDESEKNYISDCCASGTVHAENASFQDNAGGFSGQVKMSRIEKCFATGNVTLGPDHTSIHVAGGFASGVYEDGKIANCYATGNVTDYDELFFPMVGSFTGRFEGNLENCYATGETTVIDSNSKQNSNNIIVGSRRGEGGIIKNCAELTNNDRGYPFMIDELIDSDYTTNKLSRESLIKENTYIQYGWDFTTVWMMPPVGSKYKLPILRGSFEKEQQTFVMAKHLI